VATLGLHFAITYRRQELVVLEIQGRLLNPWGFIALP